MPASSRRVVQHARRAPGIAEILERHEVRAQRVRLRPVPLAARREQPAAEPGRDATGACRQAGQPEIPQVDDGRPLAHAADDPRPVDVAQQPVEVRVLMRVVANDRVLDGDGHAVVDQPADRIEARLSGGAEAVLRLEIEDQRDARGVRDLAQARLHALRVARIAARQHHRAGERVPLEEARLIDRTAERGTHAGDGPARRREPGQPAEERLVLVERDVVEERVAAVEISRDAAGRDVARHAFGRVEVEAAPRVALAREGRHRVDARDRVCRHGRALYVFVTPFLVFATVKLPSRCADTLIACAVVSSTLAMRSSAVLESRPPASA